MFRVKVDVCKSVQPPIFTCIQKMESVSQQQQEFLLKTTQKKVSQIST